jgi:hypothetical protein
MFFPNRFHSVVSCHPHIMGVGIARYKILLFLTKVFEILWFSHLFGSSPISFSYALLLLEGLAFSLHKILGEHILLVFSSIPCLTECSVFHIIYPTFMDREVLHNLCKQSISRSTSKFFRTPIVNVQPVPRNTSSNSLELPTCQWEFHCGTWKVNFIDWPTARQPICWVPSTRVEILGRIRFWDQ